MTQIKIQTLNCRGLGNRVKRRDFFKRFREQDIQITCLQDIHIDPKLEMCVKAEWGLNCIICPYTSHARGVAILFNSNFEYEIHKSRRDVEGNFIILDITIDKTVKFTLVNLYGPNEDTPDFYNNIFNIVQEFDNESTILCGDWNLVLDPKKDLYNYKAINNPKARNVVKSYIDENDLVDVWRSFNENEEHFTWGIKNPIKMARLDFFLATEDLMANFSSSSILPKYKSDHAPVLLKMNTTSDEHGKGYWKFNNSLLRDQNFVKIVIKLKFQI